MCVKNCLMLLIGEDCLSFKLRFEFLGSIDYEENIVEYKF